MKSIFALVILALATEALTAPVLEPSLQRKIQAEGSAHILISFKNADVGNVRTQAIAKAHGRSRAAVTQAMYDALKAHADQTQGNALNVIRNYQAKHASGAKVYPFWITNQIGIKNVDARLLQELSTVSEIAKIEEAGRAGLIEPVAREELPESQVLANEQWGILAIDAPSVWAEGDRGANVTVGSLDTGVMASHEALRDAYRADHGWYDPAEGWDTPTDLNGHGTHTIGTMVGGTNGIGVAPEAKFIACKGMDRTGSGLLIDFIACGQFFVCPHLPTGPNDDPRCDLAPVAVGNSWGTLYNFGFFDEVINAWMAAGIAPVFAAGNEGYEYGCFSLRTPGDNKRVLTIGATNEDNALASFSSKGPSPEGFLKPIVSAPGTHTISASTSSETAYSSMSGTSMATPHVVGLIALLHSKRPNLRVGDVQSLLIVGAQPVTPRNETCGAYSDLRIPNNHVGYGRINARASVDGINNLL